MCLQLFPEDALLTEELLLLHFLATHDHMSQEPQLFELHLIAGHGLLFCVSLFLALYYLRILWLAQKFGEITLLPQLGDISSHNSKDGNQFADHAIPHATATDANLLAHLAVASMMIFAAHLAEVPPTIVISIFQFIVLEEVTIDELLKRLC